MNTLPNWDSIWLNANPFGKTITGDWSLAELQDLLLAKDDEIKAIQDAFNSTPSNMWSSPSDYNDWRADWAALQARYWKAKSNALTAIVAGTKGFITDLTIQSGQTEYDAVLRALKKDPSTVTKGDSQDLFNRLNNVKIVPPMTISQPSAYSDASQNLSDALAPFDPLGDKKAAENWKKDLAIGIAATVLGTLVAASIYKHL
jgi:hypothetical protein